MEAMLGLWWYPFTAPTAPPGIVCGWNIPQPAFTLESMPLKSLTLMAGALGGKKRLLPQTQLLQYGLSRLIWT